MLYEKKISFFPFIEYSRKIIINKRDQFATENELLYLKMSFSKIVKSFLLLSLLIKSLCNDISIVRF